MHCPATLLLASTPQDEGGVAALVDELTREMVLAVVTAPGDTRGAAVAERLGAPVEEEPGLVVGPPASDVLGELADLHRGETVLVLSPPAGSVAADGAAAVGTPVIERIERGAAY